MKRIFIKLIEIYKKNISEWLGHRGVHCKYYPTCSEYAVQALEKYGAIKGSFLAIIRFFKCNPFSKGGYDPLK